MSREQTPLRDVLALLEVGPKGASSPLGYPLADLVLRVISKHIGDGLLRGDGTIVHPRHADGTDLPIFAGGKWYVSDGEDVLRPIMVRDLDDAGGAT